MGSWAITARASHGVLLWEYPGSRGRLSFRRGGLFSDSLVSQSSGLMSPILIAASHGHAIHTVFVSRDGN